MALRIRLARGGSKKRPFYKIVVADARAPRDGRFIEKLGTYNPMLPQDHNDRITLNTDRVKHWLSVGAEPSDRVARFLGYANIIKIPAVVESPKKSAPKAKAQERLRLAEEAAREAAEAAAAPAPEPVAEPEPVVEEAAPVEAPAETPVEEVPAEEAAAEA